MDNRVKTDGARTASMRRRAGLAGLTFCALTALATGARADPPAGTFYETFGRVTAAYVAVGQPVLPFATLTGVGSNIVAGGGKVYIQRDNLIEETNPDLTGLALYHVNGGVPTDIAVDGSTGVFFESFAGDELAAYTTGGQPVLPFATLSVNATNIVAGNGKLYWQDQNLIYSANSDLTDVQLFHVNGGVPTDIAFDASTNIFYESFAGDELAAYTTGGQPVLPFATLAANATNIVAGGGKLYWQDGSTINVANWDLSGATQFHLQGAVPVDIALLPATPPGVPEPSVWGLTIIGFGLAGAALRRRARTALAA